MELKVVTNPDQRKILLPGQYQQPQQPKLSVASQPLSQQKLSVAPPADANQQIASVGTATEQRPYTPRMSLSDFGKTIKQKYPQYNDIPDEELGARTLEKYPEYADRVQTPIATTQRAPQDRSGGFFSRLGGDITERVENLRSSSRLVDEGKQGNLGFGFQTAGQLAGLVGDVAMEGLTSAWRTVAPKSWQEGLAKSGEDLAGSGAAQSLMQKYEGFKEAHPVAAKNVEAGLNIASLIPVGRGAKMAATPVGEIAGKGASLVEKQVAKRALDEAITLIEPQLTKKPATSALKKGLGRVTAIGKLVIEASPADKKIANAIKDVVDISKSIPENITRVRDSIAEISERVIRGLEATPAIFNQNQMKSFLNKTKDASKVIFGSDKTLESQYDAVIDLYMEQLSKQKNNLAGALEARKQFDNIIEQKFPNLYNNPMSDVVRTNAIKDVRRAVNDFIETKLPEGNTFKADLKRQSEMFSAIDRMAAKQFAVANRELLDGVTNIFKKHPIATAAGLVGIGTTFSLANPIVLASILMYGSFKVGKKVLTLRNLAKALRTVQKLLNPQEKEAINAIMRAMRNSVGLTTMNVGGEGFQNFTDLSLKTLARLEGKTTVSKQFIQDLTKMADIKQVERDLINEVLQNYDETVNVKTFADDVKKELLPLTSKEVSPRYESINLEDGMRGPVEKYSENIYESPIETQAGYIHFNQNQRNKTLNYFGHSRVEDLPDAEARVTGISGIGRYKDGKGGVRRIIELQSDLMQKGNLEAEKRRIIPYEGRTKELNQIEGKSYEDSIVQATNERNAMLDKKLGVYRNLWHERLIKEEVKKAAQDGKSKLQFPTGDTAMKIEGLGQEDAWQYSTFLPDGTYDEGYNILTPNKMKVGMEVFRGDDDWIITEVLRDGKFKAVNKYHMNEFFDNVPSYDPDNPGKILKKISAEELEDLKMAEETFDISGNVDKSNPIYRFYEKEVGRYLKNKYNAKLVTDDQGVTWWEIDIKDDYGKLPIEAYAAAPLTLGAISERNNQ